MNINLAQNNMNFCFMRFVTLLHFISASALFLHGPTTVPKMHILSLSLIFFTLSAYHMYNCIERNSDQPHSLYTNIYMRIAHQQTHTYIQTLHKMKRKPLCAKKEVYKSQ